MRYGLTRGTVSGDHTAGPGPLHAPPSTVSCNSPPLGCGAHLVLVFHRQSCSLGQIESLQPPLSTSEVLAGAVTDTARRMGG